MAPALVQSLHAPPPEPQALSRFPFLMHVFPEQQPFAQVAGPHGGTLQAPPSHVPPWFVQFWQTAPLPPQAVFSLPGAQKSPTQQPPQLSGPHVLLVSTHVPVGLHVSFDEQV